MQPGPVRLPVGDAQAILEKLQKYLDRKLEPADARAFIEQFNSDQSVASTTHFKTVEQTSDYLLKELRDARIDLTGSEGLADLIEEARSYFWVQFRESAAGPWTDVHPAFAETPPDMPAPEQFYGESIPESLQHRLRLQMFVEIRRGNLLEVLPVSEPWERPVANLSAEPMVFGNLPDTMLDGGLPSQDLETSLNRASYFAPVFNGNMAPGARFFDLNGNLIDPMVASSAATGVFKKVGDAFLSAAGGLGGDPAAHTLTAQWLEYTFIAPGGETRTVRRTTFDRIGPAARADGRIPGDLTPTSAKDVRTLMQRHTLMVQTGRTPRGLALDYGLARMQETYPAVIAFLRLAQLGEQPSSAELQRLARISEEWSGHLQLFTMMDGADSLRPGVTSYRSGPGLVAHRQGLSGSDGSLAAIDIIANPRRSLSMRQRELTMDPSVSMLGGIWETATEGILLSNGAKSISTETVFDNARSAGIPVVAISPNSDVSGLTLSDDALFHLQADLSSDYAVIVPRMAAPGEMAGWWRVNVHTGETLGQLGDGRGSQAVDYINILSFGISCGMLAYGVDGCQTQFSGGGAANNARMGCCIIANFVMFGIGYLTFGLGGGTLIEGMTLAGASRSDLMYAALMAATGSAAWDAIGALMPFCR